MVLRRGDARHKNAPDPLEAGPKRITTIHAQRKFAQGAGMNSPAMSPIKEKEKSKANGAATEPPAPSTSAIPAKRPRTEDFITFLCYRGTSVLPPALNSFNVASKPEKNDRETGSVAGSSKQAASSSRQEKELKRAKQTKRMVMQSKSKVLDQRQRKTRINAIAAQKAGKVLKNRKVNPPITKERLKKAANAAVNANHKQLKSRPAVSVRASHPSLLKRISASRARAGLRSGGQLPPGSDAGIKTDRKPRDQAMLRGKHLVSNVKRKTLTPVRMKVKRVNKASPVTPISQKLKRGQPLSKATLRKTSPPKSLSITSRPSRKTKEAATLYMEMITKDLRSPDDEEEEEIAESPLKSEDVETDATPVKTRTRSANVESTTDVSPARSPKSKPIKKNRVTAQSPPPSSMRRSLKRITGLSSNVKSLNKKTRASNKEETPNAGPFDDESSASLQGRASRRSATTKNNQETTPTLSKSNRLASASAKKVSTPKQNNAGKAEGESYGKSEGSSHSDEEGESSSSHPSPKKLRKVSDRLKADKALPGGGKKSGTLKKIGQDVSKRDSKKIVDEIDEEDGGQDKTPKRSTRSTGGDTSIKGDDVSGDAIKKVQIRTKIKTQNQKPPSSESDASDVEVTSKKNPVKDASDRKRRSAKKGNESESGEDLEDQSKNLTLKKPTRQRASAKVQENVPETATEGDKPTNKRQSRLVKSRVNKTTDNDSDEDMDVEHSPSRKQPGRVKKGSTIVKEVEKTVDSADKRTTRKAFHVDIRDKTKKTESIPIKTESDSDQGSESEGEKNITLRRTRISRPLGTPDAEMDKKVESQVKRTRNSVRSLSQPKTDESENEETTKKLRRVAKPAASKSEVSDESDKEDTASKSKKSLRQASMKSEKAADSGPELRRVSKPLASKSEVSEESDEEDSGPKPKKSLRQSSMKSQKVVDSPELRRVSKPVVSKSEFSDESDKEGSVSKSKRSLRHTSMKSERAVESPELRRVSKPVASKSEVSDESDKETSVSKSKRSLRNTTIKSEKAADSGPEIRRASKSAASKLEVSDESDKEEAVSKSKKPLRQASIKSEKAVDSGPDLRRLSKPVISKSEVSDESDKEDAVSKSKKSLRQVSLKSEKAVDSGPEEGVQKQLNKLRHPSKIESGGESDKDVQPKRQRQSVKAKVTTPEQADQIANQESDKLEKELAKPLKSGNKKPLKNTEDGSLEEDHKTVGSGTRSNKGTVKALTGVNDENADSEFVTKRSSRFSQQSSVSGTPGEIKNTAADLASQNTKELATSKSSSADFDSRKDFTPKQTRNSSKNLPEDAHDIENAITIEKDNPAKKVGKAVKSAVKDKADQDNLSKEKKEVRSLQPQVITKPNGPSEEGQTTSLIDINKKNVVADNDEHKVKTVETKDTNKKLESSQPKKPAKKTEIKAENKSMATKEVAAPAKRGRPKKVEVVEEGGEVEKVSEENEVRPRTKRKAAAKSLKSIKESYSEFSDEEEVDVSLPRTRERKSNIRYTEKDTDESEVASEGEVEKRPRRSRRSVFPTSLALDLDSDEEFVQPSTRATRNRFKSNKKGEKSNSDYSDEEPTKSDNDSTNKKDLNAATVAAKKVVEKAKYQNDKKPAAAKDKTAEQTSAMNKALGKVKNDDGNSSDSSLKKSRNSRRNSLNTKEFLESKRVIDEALEKPLIFQGSEASIALGKEIRIDNPNDLCIAPTKLEDSLATLPDVLEKTNLSLSHTKEETVVNLTQPTSVPSMETSSDIKPEPKRLSRRLSKDKANLDDVPVVHETKTPDHLIPLELPGKQGSINQSIVPESTSFGLSTPNKGDYDALAILSDVAFSELQNRKNIMDRKLSSDSATSFSSDDVLLPVRKEKVLPKAKADLPTVREKTESDEEISDVGNEDTDEDSSYDEYRKVDKQPRRKRLPRRIRKEPVRQQSQRPVRSRRAKQTDSYVDDDYFSSDRSSSPETSPVKPVQKKRRKSEDKPTTLASIPITSKTVASALGSPPTNTTISVPSAPPVLEIKIPPEPPTPSIKPTKEVKPSVPKKEEMPKVQEPQRNIPAKTLPSKPVVQTEPVLNVPRPQPPPPQAMPKVRVTLQSDVKNNNSVTLFSGVSGVTVSKTDRMSVVYSSPSPKEVPQVVSSFSGSPRVGMESPVKPPPYVPARSPIVSSSHSALPKSNLFNMKSSTDTSNLSVSTDVKPKPNITDNYSNDIKPKPNIGDTWKNAFKNAKIPKAGQLSPAHHSSVGTPFTRKPFSNAPKPASKPDDAKPNAFVPTKLPSVQTFKPTSFPNFGKLGNQSPSRMPSGMSPSRPPIPGPPGDSKSNVYLSPSRVKNSSSKVDDKSEIKKTDSMPTKSLTLLQYEKRSQDLISSLKGSQPVLVDGIQAFAQAFPKLKEYNMEKAKSSPVKVAPPSQQSSAEDASKSEGGKHLNLPFAVEHAFRKRSPITVKKPVKPPVEKKAGPSLTIPEMPTPVNVSIPRDRPPAAVPLPSSEPNRTTTNLELLSKKKVQMTNEEIKKWLDDNTSSGVEHAKDCGIFENNQCECSYRTSGESMLNTSVGGVTEIAIKKEDPKIDHGVVEPPVQLKELDSGAKFTAETISTCKVEDYKEKMLIKTPPQPPTPEVKKELVPPSLPNPKVRKPMNLVVDKSKRKSSMTEDEMCEFDFRFERTSNSPRESCSDMSSPTPRDDVSSSNEEKFDPSSGGLEKKSIFNQRRQIPGQLKRPPLSKSPCAFSAENESSVYAFEPDAPLPALNNPFRRRGSRHKSSEDDGPASSSIAVQVNLENVASGDNDQLECSTQTEQVENEGQLFYFPLEGDSNPQEVIQGVQVKLQSTEGPEQKVIMKAKLVTKPSLNIPSPPTSRPLGDGGRVPQRPEQKVRPLATTSTSTQSKPLGTVQPTVREPQPSCSASFTSQGTTTSSDRPDLANQSTQAAAVPQLVPNPTAQTSSQPETVKLPETPAPISVPKPPVKSAPVTPAPRKSAHEFPVPGTTARMVDAPTFHPTEKEFQDPLEYIEQITPQARSFGICRIVPPASFKPECKVTDDMRFTAYNQYVHKMLYRWGPNVREMTAIKKYLATQCIALKQPPLIGGMEIDLPRLYQTVQSCGGLKEVIEKKRWAKVADVMKIPKAAQDRVTKLDDIYCKFLLPYDTLSHSERSKLLEEVDAEWTERERRIALEAERESKGEKEEKEDNSESDEESDDGRDECMTKGKTMPLSQFYRVARNTMAMWFKEPNPSAKDVENEYWRLVTSRKQHVCVNSGSIDSGASGYGFPTSKSSSTSRHPWNLKVLTNNGGSILRSMGPLMGVTVPTLHVGMLFSACCWYRDPHGLPWIEYLHTGANKIWYAVPDLWNEELHGAMRTILPRYCQDKPIWLASDTAMVPPDLLVQQRVSLCRAVQEPGQFILVFPKAFTSTICTGYIVSESVYFAQPSWLDSATQIFKDIQESCEPPAFSMERLLFNMATDVRSSAEVLTQILPMITELRDTELKHRKDLADLGVTETERLAVSKGGRKRSQEEPQEYECEICRGNLYLSLVSNSVEEANFCLLHSVETLTKDRSHVKNCKLMYSYDEEEMDEVIEKIKQRIETKSCKKQNKTTSGSGKV